MREQQQRRNIEPFRMYRERNLMNINAPIPLEWTNYVTQMAGKLEVVPAVLYDTLTIATATAGPFDFFTTKRATIDLSNMQTPGQLPSPSSFLIQGIRIYFKNRPQMVDSGAAGPTSLASLSDDIAQLANTGVLTGLIGEKRLGPFPLWMLPAGTGPDVRWTQAGAEAANITANYAQLGGNFLYGVFPNLMIASMQQFSFSLVTAAAMTLSVSLVPSIVLDGQLARAVQ